MKGQKTGGRKKGSRNKSTKARAEALKRIGAGTLTEDAHALLVLIYQNPQLDIAVRIDAAKAALPYEKPRLSPIEPARKADDHVPLAERVKEYTRCVAIEASGGKVVDLARAAQKAR